MVFEIHNEQEFKEFIKSTIDKTNNISVEAAQNSVSAFLDQTGVRNKSLEILEDELQCIICLEIPLQACLTKCKHIFCIYCLNTCTWEKYKCPICRTAFPKPNYEMLHKTDKIINAVISKLDPQYDLWRKRELHERFCKYYTESLQRLDEIIAICSKNVEPFKCCEKFRKDLGDVAQKFKALRKELPCSEANTRQFRNKYAGVFGELRSLCFSYRPLKHVTEWPLRAIFEISVSRSD